MQRAVVVLVVGLVGSTSLLPAQDWESEVAILRCQTDPGGHMTVSHRNVTNNLITPYSTVRTVREQYLSCSILGMKLLDGPRATTFSADSRRRCPAARARPPRPGTTSVAGRRRVPALLFLRTARR